MLEDNPYGNSVLVDALRISDAEWYACVEEMDQLAMAGKRPVDRRGEPRQPYRNIARIIVSFRSYDGLLQQFKVRAYDLSPIGLGFLHGAYIYNDTPAEIYMQHHVNGMTCINAKIVSCLHVRNRIHRVGAQFEEPIELADYLMSEAG